MIPLCSDQGVGVIPWSPLARGVLAGNRTRDGRAADHPVGHRRLHRLPLQPAHRLRRRRAGRRGGRRTGRASGPGGPGLAARTSPGSPPRSSAPPSRRTWPTPWPPSSWYSVRTRWPGSRSPTCPIRCSATSDDRTPARDGPEDGRGRHGLAAADRRSAPDHQTGGVRCGERRGTSLPHPERSHDQADGTRVADECRLPLRHHVPVRLPDLALDPGGAGPSRRGRQLAVLQPRGDQPGRGQEAPVGAGLVLRLVDDAHRCLPAAPGSRSARPLVPGGRSGPPRGRPQAPPSRGGRDTPGRDGPRPGHGPDGHRRSHHRRRGPRRARPRGGQGRVRGADAGLRRRPGAVRAGARQPTHRRGCRCGCGSWSPDGSSSPTSTRSSDPKRAADIDAIANAFSSYLEARDWFSVQHRTP